MNRTDAELFQSVVQLDFRMKGAHSTPPKTWMFYDVEKNKCDVESNNDDVENKNNDVNIKLSKKNNRKNSASIIAEKLNTSSSMVERIRLIIDYGGDSLQNDIREGRIRISEAYRISAKNKKVKEILLGKIPVEYPANPKIGFPDIFGEMIGDIKFMTRFRSQIENNISEFIGFQMIAKRIAEAGWMDEEELSACNIRIKESFEDQNK